MLFNNLDVRVTLRGDVDEKLPEYARVRSDKDTVECWIPSTQGRNFAIGWNLIKRPARARLGLRCRLWLDGVDLRRYVLLTPPDINAGTSGDWNSIYDDKMRQRLFLFGKLNMTDQEDLAPSNQNKTKDLNTIKVKLTWVRGCKKVYKDDSSEDSDNSESDASDREIPDIEPQAEDPVRWVNERDTLKGHGGSAELGPPLPASPRQGDNASTKGKKKKCKRKGKDRDYYWSYEEVDSPPASFFIFHYAPRDWLEDREIIRQRSPPPVIDLSRATSYLPPTENSAHDQANISLHSPDPDREPAQMRSDSVGLEIRSPKPEPLDRSAEDELLRPPDEFGTTDDISLVNQLFEREEKAGLIALADSHHADTTDNHQPSGSSVTLAKRSREPGSPFVIDVDLLSSDDEPTLLDTEPTGQSCAKRPRLKSEGEDLKLALDVFDTKPEISATQELDPWRLGC